MRPGAKFGAVGTLAAVAVAAVLLWPHGGTPSAVNDPATTFTQQDATTLSSELGSGALEQVRRAVLVPEGQPLPRQLATSLKAMGKLTFDAASFTATQDGTATVTATATPVSGAPRRWLVYLVHGATGWQLAATQAL